MGPKTYEVGSDATEAQKDAIKSLKFSYAGEIKSIWTYSNGSIEFHISSDETGFYNYEIPDGYRFDGVTPCNDEIEIKLKPKA